MAKRWIWVGICACSVVVAGCDPIFELEGHVADASDAPIAGARAWIRCGDHDANAGGVTDARGYFRDNFIGWRANDCVIKVTAPGHPDIALGLGHHCSRTHGSDACLGVHLDVVMP
jgi:hypothetical protein